MNNYALFTKADAYYDQREYDRAFELFIKAARAGDTSSMLRVASMYTCGEGVRCDYRKAIEWELKAVNAGDNTALVNLGISYRVVGDIRNAKRYFERSIAAGDSSAALQLAKLYLVSERETHTAVKYLRQALEDKNLVDVDQEEARALLDELDT